MQPDNNNTSRSDIKDLLRQISQVSDEKFQGPVDSLLDQMIHLMHSEQKPDREDLIRFLESTSRKEFLQKLSDTEKRFRWADLVFDILQQTNYGLKEMMVNRVEEHPDKTLFINMMEGKKENYTYRQIFQYTKEIAATFYKFSRNPRVAIFSDNSVDSAASDLACLMYGVFDTPLNIHFTEEILIVIFRDLQINIVVADTTDRVKKLLKIKEQADLEFHILVTQPVDIDGVESLQKHAKSRNYREVDEILSRRKLPALNKVATTMFTSGSTGIPKGVSFSYYNLISKRFARHAALPETGNETFLSFLPLFHTFGRYLELMGSIYWHGTYVFVGNSSSETLLRLFPLIQPTGFISVPIRWMQLYMKAMQKMEKISNSDLRVEILRKEVVGKQLRWGLSAAGYLSPKVFHFFQNHGVSLSSGFGMTEATGGITMTPPGDYHDDSTGKPLPGVYTRLKENGELEISGHYIARYLEEAQPGDSIPYPDSDPDKNYWLSTGDIFTVSPEGHYTIVDRVKDIYKNNKGQTIAPRTIEQKFVGVPGVKHAFLVGDARPFNVLLIVPDMEHTVVKSQESEENLVKYYHQIVQAANVGVAPYERVVNFTVLLRDFSLEKKELTPKGSYNRKVIEKNFQTTIRKLYKSDKTSYKVGSFTVLIPLWFYRDLGILENDIVYKAPYFINQVKQTKLLFKIGKDNKVVIGDLSYEVRSKQINLGRLARQPVLWLGNSEFINFSPVKEGWDLPLKEFTGRICFPDCLNTIKDSNSVSSIPTVSNSLLLFIHQLMTDALFSEGQAQKNSIRLLGDQLSDSEQRMARTIRQRLEALSCHTDQEVRTLAYQSLLIHDPNPDIQEVIPAFIRSGKTFLDDHSIQAIAGSGIGKKQLETFRRRMHVYRENMKWPAKGATRKQFSDILDLLYNFGKQNPNYYKTIRAEFAAWILHPNDTYLSNKAKKLLHKLYLNFDEYINNIRKETPAVNWNEIIVFEYGIPIDQRKRLTRIITETVFLEASIRLIYDQSTFTVNKINKEGLWVTRLQSYSDFRHFRITVNSVNNKHYDLHVVITRKEKQRRDENDLYWNAFLSDYPFDNPVLSSLGLSNSRKGIRSSQYQGGLSVWEKIRQMAEIHQWAENHEPYAWHQLFIRSFAVVFRTWKISGRRIIPGAVSPLNIMVPELEFKESASIISLTGYAKYHNIGELMVPMIRNFYQKIIALYPWAGGELKLNWIYKAMLESLGQEETFHLLAQWKNLIPKQKDYFFQQLPLEESVNEFILEQKDKHYYTLKIHSAIAQFSKWLTVNPDATKIAREQTLFEIFDLFKIYQFAEIDRYYFFRHTYFSELGEEVKKAFDILMDKIEENPETETIQLLELSDLQATLKNPTDRKVFSRMVFPKMKHYQAMDIVKIVDNKNNEQISIQTTLTDKSGLEYIMREPMDATEVGKMYQLFYEENYPKTPSRMDKHFVVVDKFERVIGGICYRELENNIILLDGTAVTNPLQGKGIGSAMVNDFFTRMATKGVATIKAHYLLGNYFLKHNFKVDKKWGALVKHLD
ncbi:MAG: AMP-binding protein [Bacteroidales bacterium]|nr:AMP-binding protein [Bacteroidales bacterium]